MGKKKQKSPDDLLSVSEAAKILKMTPAGVRDCIHAGRLSAQQIGGWSWAIKRSDVTSYKKEKAK